MSSELDSLDAEIASLMVRVSEMTVRRNTVASSVTGSVDRCVAIQRNGQRCSIRPSLGTVCGRHGGISRVSMRDSARVVVTVRASSRDSAVVTARKLPVDRSGLEPRDPEAGCCVCFEPFSSGLGGRIVTWCCQASFCADCHAGMANVAEDEHEFPCPACRGEW